MGGCMSSSSSIPSSLSNDNNNDPQQTTTTTTNNILKFQDSARDAAAAAAAAADPAIDSDSNKAPHVHEYDDHGGGDDEYLSSLEFAVNKDKAKITTKCDGENDNQEYIYFLKEISRKNYSVLENAPYHIRNNKSLVMTAIENDLFGKSLINVLKFASSRLQNDRDVVLPIIRRNGLALEFASPDLRNDKEVVHGAVWQNGLALQYASPSLQSDKEVVIEAVGRHSYALEYASPSLQKDKDVALALVRNDPDGIKYFPDSLKRDRDLLIASGMFDEEHQVRQKDATKIVLSTRFSLDPESRYEATNFTALLKKSNFFRLGNYIVYAPNAFDKKTCDPQWTNFHHPCRGTKDTCKFKNILTWGGNPTDNCCWRYSFRHQLQEAKDTGGFMLQLVESGKEDGKVEDATLGNGQSIELDMAASMGVKAFHVYRPEGPYNGYEFGFTDSHIDFVTQKISQWYNHNDDDDDDDDGRDINNHMSVTAIRQPYYGHKIIKVDDDIHFH